MRMSAIDAAYGGSTKAAISSAIPRPSDNTAQTGYQLPKLEGYLNIRHIV